MTEKEAAKMAKDVASTSKQLNSLLGESDIVDRLLAKHPNAAASLLAKLSRSGDKTTRKQVALNPNSAKEVLLALAPQFPLDFFRNPAFDWLLLEDPDLLINLGQGVLKNILKRPECPESFMQWASRHGSEQEMLAVAMNPAAPLDALQRLSSCDGPVALAAKSHEKLASSAPLPDPATVLENEVKSALAELGAGDARTYWKRGWIGPEKWLCLGIKARLDVLDISDWVYRDDWVVRHADQLMSDADPMVREIVASSQLAPPSLLEVLANEEDPLVDWALCCRPCEEQLAAESIATDPAELQRLAASETTDVQLAVASNREARPRCLRIWQGTAAPKSAKMSPATRPRTFMCSSNWPKTRNGGFGRVSPATRPRTFRCLSDWPKTRNGGFGMLSRAILRRLSLSRNCY
jgi:hypothetical protein